MKEEYLASRHLRAAHWHTYLYGPGKKLRKVLLVAATWVGTGEEDVDVIHVQESTTPDCIKSL